MNLMSKIDESGVIISTYDSPTSYLTLMLVGIGIIVLGGLVGFIYMKFTDNLSIIMSIILSSGGLGIALVITSGCVYSNSQTAWESEAAEILNEHYGKEIVTSESLNEIELNEIVGKNEHPIKTIPVATDIVRNQETGEWTEQSLFLIVDGNVVEILTEEGTLKAKEKQWYE